MSRNRPITSGGVEEKWKSLGASKSSKNSGRTGIPTSRTRTVPKLDRHVGVEHRLTVEGVGNGAATHATE